MKKPCENLDNHFFNTLPLIGRRIKFGLANKIELRQMDNNFKKSQHSASVFDQEPKAQSFYENIVY